MSLLSEKDTKDIDLTAEFVKKSDLDIHTIKSIMLFGLRIRSCN